jgi:hypothetical protein
MEKTRSNIDARCSKPTPHKRGAQVAMIKAIQHKVGHYRPEGHWIHTAGPSKVAINYWIHEQAFHPDSKYILTETYPDRADKMKREASYLRKQLKQHPRANTIAVRNTEIFNYTMAQIWKDENIVVIEADLCSAPRTMEEVGVLIQLQDLCNYQRYRKDPLFLALTYSIRNRTDKDRRVLQEIDVILGEDKIAQTSYKDGNPMETTTWKVRPQIY